MFKLKAIINCEQKLQLDKLKRLLTLRGRTYSILIKNFMVFPGLNAKESRCPESNFLVNGCVKLTANVSDIVLAKPEQLPLETGHCHRFQVFGHFMMELSCTIIFDKTSYVYVHLVR